jgi:hypothetical protein
VQDSLFIFSCLCLFGVCCGIEQRNFAVLFFGIRAKKLESRARSLGFLLKYSLGAGEEWKELKSFGWFILGIGCGFNRVKA